MRKFALSSGAYRRFKLVQAVRHVALAGYAGVEILADIPHGYPPTFDKTDRDGLRSALAKDRLAVANVNAGPMTAIRDDLRPSWVEADRVLRNERIRHTLDAGELARDVGAPTVTTIGGGPLEGMSPEDARAHFVDGLGQVAEAVAKGKCPRVLICPEPGLLVDTAEQVRRVIDAVGADGIGADVNTGHCRRAEEDAGAAVRELDALLGHVHLEDVDDRGAVVVPGSGGVDFEAVFAALDEIGYDGWLTVDLSGADVHPDEAARQALEFLEQFES
ncbi:MAG: sugar phosphate isomerase/epimerase family protein [bacterium]